MPATVIIGTQWGDEGKGKVVDLLAASADVVVRFHGGNNAGHTLVVNGEKTILNLVPAGVLHPGRICMLGPGVVIDPEVLVGEIESLRKRGYLAEDRWLRISEQAHLIMPYHRAIDRARERLRGAGNIGTTGRGIGPAYEDKMARTGIRVGDLFDATGFRRALPDRADRRARRPAARRRRRVRRDHRAPAAVRLVRRGGRAPGGRALRRRRPRGHQARRADRHRPATRVHRLRAGRAPPRVAARYRARVGARRPPVRGAARLARAARRRARARRSAERRAALSRAAGGAGWCAGGAPLGRRAA